VGKVKKAGAARKNRTKVAKGRQTRASPAANKTDRPKRRAPSLKRQMSRAKRSSKKGLANKGLAKKLPPKKAEPSVRFIARALDPLKKCGAGTSVQRLYRVDEAVDGTVARVHLVFLDRHGWYCEHGRDCAAVSHARRQDTGVKHHGPTHNGRMRV
jgi:hypothetical protein